MLNHDDVRRLLNDRPMKTTTYPVSLDVLEEIRTDSSDHLRTMSEQEVLELAQYLDEHVASLQGPFLVADMHCPECERHITFLDFAKTAVEQGAHGRDHLREVVAGRKGGVVDHPRTRRRPQSRLCRVRNEPQGPRRLLRVLKHLLRLRVMEAFAYGLVEAASHLARSQAHHAIRPQPMMNRTIAAVMALARGPRRPAFWFGRTSLRCRSRGLRVRCATGRGRPV